MKCPHREEVVLGAGTREAPPDHIRECADCREAFEKAAGAWRLLGEMPGVRPSAGFFAGVREKLGRAPWWRVLIPIGVAAAAVIAVLFALPDGQTPQPDAPGVHLSPEDREVVQNLDLLENYELLQAMEMVDEQDLGKLFEQEN